MAWATGLWSRAPTLWRRSDARARTVTPRFTAATVRRERCCTGRRFESRMKAECPRKGRAKGQGSEMAMKTRSRELHAIVAALLSACACLTAPGARAADVIFYPTELAQPIPGWWQHYYVEAGVRGFLNNPPR